ncbi:MAG: CHASE3 domain-containing protein [Pyrinomonadaceae bacterium]|nr:CHASE3 domain-containing protein [Pyrinomonadaceae bacterium]
MKLALEKLIPTAFLLAIGLLVILGFFSYQSVKATNNAIEWEMRTQQVLQALNDSLINLVDAETGVRGFVITSNETFLEPYLKAEQDSSQNINRLRELLKDNPEQLQRLNNLENLFNEKLRISKQHINTRRNEGEKAAIETVSAGEGKAAMDKVRAVVSEMKSVETSILREREKELKDNFSRASIFLIIGGIGGIFLLTLGNVLIYRENNKRTLAETELKNVNRDLEKRVAERTKEIVEANEALRHSEEFNRSIFESSPDCVKILDLDGNLISMNKNGMCVMEIDDFAPFIGKDWKEFWQDKEKQLVYETIASARKGTAGNFVAICDTAKGTSKWWEVTVAPVYNGEGDVVRLISVSRDISERRAAEAEREKLLVSEKDARRDAETANRMRDEFLATVSHELRNPLNAMLGWARLLQKNQLDGDASRKAVETIVRNAESQNRLIEDLLDVSRIIAGKLRLDIATIQPNDFVQAAIDAVKPAAEAKNIRIETSIDEDLNNISGDANRLQQVIWNLLSNAIKFTPKNGEVKISVEALNSMIEINIKDDGLGISPDFLPHVFDRFRQADASTIKKFGGLGLGLAIVRHITEMHGGTVEAFSEGEGKGSTFTLKLPILAIALEAEQVSSSKEIEASSFVGKTGIDLNGLYILTVDDEPDTCQLLEQVLTHYGANVKTVMSASEALSEFVQKQPDILISDIGMPEEDGYSLIQKIRAIPDNKTKKMPAIALTAFARPQDRMKALAAGFQTHVSKPVEPDELATVIASLTGRL